MNELVWSPHKARVAADFGAAAPRYNRVARLQKIVIELLLKRLQPVAGHVLDLGCGTGLALKDLAAACPQADVVAMDLAEGMVRHARADLTEGHERSLYHWLAGDAEALPLADGSLDLVFSSLAIQWCENLASVFQEQARVLKPGGQLLASTLVDGTLGELSWAWQQVDPGRAHVNRFLSESDLKAEVRRVFGSARVDVVDIKLNYPGLGALLRELKDLGARYKGAAAGTRATAPGKLRRLEAAYGSLATPAGQLPATYKVAIIQN
ncbi:methyltransferase domain-containing protein [Hydrocarboniclastica marina]|uniref:Malonyl-[acyl-carrier protein] O-methyltransferase n=1 Tax=Hydrocarboniclastica marina TaxID=2259620 RepID=A0A4P7XJ71_9ALTE|nr:methyltransferase domain-containing protein [Hydrocarboniclastica marina]QCF26604.1 methyltransferase domain-containing protein [Hydrocarboniclastica marina]